MKRAPTIVQVDLQYWRAALAEVSLLHPAVPPESKAIEIGCVGGKWTVTKAEPNVPDWTAAQFDASKGRSEGKSTTIPFVLIAARLSEQASHGVKRKAIDINKGLTVLCIPCLLDRSGGLWPDPDRHPWIPRDLMEPTLKSVAIGRLDGYDDFVSHLPGKATSLDDTLRAAAKLFEKVTGARLPLLPVAPGREELPPLFAMDGHVLVSAWHGVPYDPPVVARHLIKLYDQIKADKPSAPLLDNLRTVTDRPSRRPLLAQTAEKQYANTFGNIDPRHSLSPSQRETMVELVRLGAGEVLAVNGPPGTGKTALLMSVVAQLWIDAALKESNCPLVVVTSTNVKAVENVLDSFAKICAETGHERWHSYAGGFGLFLASESRESKHPTCTGKSHPFAEHETSEAVEEAEKLFLEQASARFERRQDSIAAAVKELHDDLKLFENRLKAIVSARYEVYRATTQDPTDGAATSCERLLADCQAQSNAESSLIRGEDQDLAICNEQIEAAETQHKATSSSIDSAEQAWNAYLANSPVWLDLLSFLPPIRRRRLARDRCFLMSDPLTVDRQHRDDGIQQHFDALRKAAMENRSSTIASLTERASAAENRRAASVRRREAAELSRSLIEKVLQRWRDALKDCPADMLDVSLDGLNDRLDLALRAPMFSAADRYWSGRWLLEMKDRLATKKTDSKGRAKLEAKYRRFAMLSPCLVSNLHMAPSFFTAWQGKDMPLWNTIDLLVVDEAGQVSPDVGAPMFALAKRALVVGDSYQIEPVWNNGEGTDRANAVKFGLMPHSSDPSYDALEGGGYTPASGNLMRIANRSCSVQKYDDVRGLMLTEHRRCVPELIGYCNELIYSGRLEPLRESIEPARRLLPPFGYLKVVGQDKTVGKSRENYDEARAIVTWLKANRARIEAHYRDSSGAAQLWNLVGIVTPFAPQKRTIEGLLRREMPDLMRKDSKLTVGTVHALQGAERAVVVFSPTYGSSFAGEAFFDKTPNMLNVAVSRAKDSFLVIGNLALFDSTRRGRPSDLLAKYLFHKEWSAPLEHAVALTDIAIGAPNLPVAVDE